MFGLSDNDKQKIKNFYGGDYVTGLYVVDLFADINPQSFHVTCPHCDTVYEWETWMFDCPFCHKEVAFKVDLKACE